MPKAPFSQFAGQLERLLEAISREHDRLSPQEQARIVHLVDTFTRRQGSDGGYIPQTLQQSEERYRKFFDNLRETVSVFEAVRDAYGEVVDWQYLDVNQAGLHILGMDREQVVGKLVSQVLGLEILAQNMAEYRRVLAAGEPSLHEVAYRDQHFLVSVFRLDEERVASMGMDITERKRVEEALLQSQQRLGDILASIHDGFFELDREWRFTYVNERAARNSSLTPEELIGESIWEKMPFILGTEYEIVYRRVMSTRQPEHQELQSLVRDMWFSLSVNPSAQGITVYWQDITERKRTERALFESEEKYRTLFEAMSEGFVVVQLVWGDQSRPVDFLILDTNPAIEHQVGLRRDQVLNRRVSQLLPVVEPLWYERFGEVVRSGKPDRFEGYSIALDRWLEVYAFSLHHDNQFCVTFRNITGRKRAETELQAAHQRTAEILESIQDVFYNIDREWRFTYVNQHAEAAWRKKSEDLIGKIIWDVFPEAEDSPSYQQLHRAMREREALHYETFSPVLNIWIDVHAYPTSEGGLTVYFRDINDRKRAEEALRYSEERFNKAFNASPIGMAISRRKDGLIQVVNDGFERIFGYTRAEVVAKTAQDLKQAPGLFDWQEAVRHLGDPVAIHDLEIAIRTRSGETRQVALSVVTLTIDEEDYSLTLIQDVTERRRLEDQARRQAARTEIHRRLIEQREQERVQIARDLHDGPVQELAGAIMTLQALLMDNLDPATAEQLVALRNRLQAQIAELRTYSQELRPPLLARFGLEKAINSHLETFREKHPELEIHFTANQVGELIPEPARVALYRIYQESLNNILKHAQASKIEIRLEKDETRALLEIRDNGAGFALPEDWVSLARQGHLGLVGIRERTEAVGGSLTIQSTPGRGTLIRVEVPL